MKQHNRFICDSYAFDAKAGRIELRYSLDDDVRLTETLHLPATSHTLQATSSELDRALFTLHLIGGISYFKTCVPKTIEVRSGLLAPPQAQFWSTVYEKGLSEFFYRNRAVIPYTPGMIQFPSQEGLRPPPLRKHQWPARTLIPVGGGKDSIVTIERTTGDVTLLRMAGSPIIDEIAAIAGKPLIVIQRQLSPLLFELNQQGALNGHIPITAYVSVLSIVIALLYGFTRILMSNEKSADEGNIYLDALEVNHQWSKSREFEEAFSAYLALWVTKDVTYGSALRDLTELEIVREFSRYSQYFHAFTSCNKNWRQNPQPRRAASEQHPSPGAAIWCGQCPKCAFVFALLAASLPRDTVLSIVGKDCFADEELWPLYQELLGLSGHKPFECVGTPAETRQAFATAIRRDPRWKDTAIVHHVLDAHAVA